jgi:elongator complex protein 2
VSLASNHAGTLALSSCKAATPEHAMVRVWSTRTWREAGAPLRGHKLTVTRASFDPTDEWIATGSRDRQVCVFRRARGSSGNDASSNAGGGGDAGAETGAGAGAGETVAQDDRDDCEYVLHQTISKAHDRIVWDVAWAPRGTRAFATGSRDKTVKIWKQEESDNESGKWVMACKLGKLHESVTALDWAFSASRAVHVLAVGFDDGAVVLHSTSVNTATSGYVVSLVFYLDSSVFISLLASFF